MVPEDLNCLTSCFKEYMENPNTNLTQIQRQCSKIGMDRQIPTYMKEGLLLVESNFTLIVPFTNYVIPLPFNPNLDCLVYYESVERTGCSKSDGVCNYIPDQKLENRRGEQKNNRLDPAINTTITQVNTDYKNKYLRASSPVTRAIEACALAEQIQFHKVHKYQSGAFFEHSDLFSNQTCDHFMPDIFGSLCSCVGSCAPENFDPIDSDREPPENLILHFLTSEGLWGCQDACKNTENCEFYTHSIVKFDKTQYAETPAAPIFQCYLWKSCDTFTLPFLGMYPMAGNVISENWSGPRNCAAYEQKCPIFWSEGEPIDPPVDYGYTECFLQGVNDQTKLRTMVKQRDFEELCRFCQAGGCGYTVW